jgi:hypothetical protein
MILLFIVIIILILILIILDLSNVKNYNLKSEKYGGGKNSDEYNIHKITWRLKAGKTLSTSDSNWENSTFILESSNISLREINKDGKVVDDKDLNINNSYTNINNSSENNIADLKKTPYFDIIESQNNTNNMLFKTKFNNAYINEFLNNLFKTYDLMGYNQPMLLLIFENYQEAYLFINKPEITTSVATSIATQQLLNPLPQELVVTPTDSVTPSVTTPVITPENITTPVTTLESVILTKPEQVTTSLEPSQLPIFSSSSGSSSSSSGSKKKKTRRKKPKKKKKKVRRKKKRKH